MLDQTISSRSVFLRLQGVCLDFLPGTASWLLHPCRKAIGALPYLLFFPDAAPCTFCPSLCICRRFPLPTACCIPCSCPYIFLGIPSGLPGSSSPIASYFRVASLDSV